MHSLDCFAFVCFVIRDFLNNYYVSDIVLDSEYSEVTSIDKFLVLVELTF